MCVSFDAFILKFSGLYPYACVGFDFNSDQDLKDGRIFRIIEKKYVLALMHSS
jgi:hypothetical protein